MLCIKNNENPKQLNFLIDALLFTDQPSAEYCEGVSRAFSIRQSFLVPFFGNFIKDLHTIFQSMSSLAVRAFNQATINQLNNSPAQPSASLHFGDRRQLDFVFNYNGEDVYLSRIGVGNLVNVEKMNAAERVLSNISAFHIHAGRRLIDLTKCIKAASPEQADADKPTANGSKAVPVNQSGSNIKSSDSREENRPENEQQQPKSISAQCSPTDRQQTNQPTSDLHESTSLVNITNLTTSASISAGNLNTLASTNAGSVPLSPLATSSTAQTFQQQQQQQISTICNALHQYNLQSNNNNAPSNQAITTPVSATLSTNTTTGLDSNQFLDNNNNRLGEQQTEKTSSNQCLHGSVKEPKPRVLASNMVENDGLYELDHKYNYKPIQPFAYRHDVSFIPLSGEQFYSNLNALQLMQHGKLRRSAFCSRIIRV